MLRDGPAYGPHVEGRASVAETWTADDIAAVRRRVVGVVWRAATEAEVDDEVQLEVTRAWLSGRGLPTAVAERRAEVVRRVVQRVLTAPGGRSWLGSRRVYARTHAPVAAVDASGAAASHGTAAQVEAHLDAQRLAHEVASWPGRYRGRTWADRASAVLSAVVDAQAGDATGAWTDAGTELGVSRQAARQTGETMLARLRAFADGA